MAKCYLLPILLLLAPALMAQPVEQPVRLANGNFFTGDNIRNNSFRQSALQPVLHNGQYYVLVKFAQLPDAAQQQALQQAGVQLLQYLPGRAYLATIEQRFDFAAAARQGIASINALPPMYKLDARILNYTPTADKGAQPLMAVALMGEAARTPALEALAQLGATVVPQPLHNRDVVFVQPDTALARAIAALPYVAYIHLQPMGNHNLNHNSVGAQAISALQNGKGLLGKGVSIGIGDDADVSSHIDFSGRLINRAYGFANDHGVHVTGTAAGSGLFNPLYRGMAPRATIVSQIYAGIIYNTPSYITDHGMVLTNNSYHTGELNCPGNSVYDINSRFVDAQTLGYNQLLHVVAAGNDGSYSCAGFPAGFATVKSGWQCAKNVLTVGAAKIDDYTIAPFSSRGPVKDGRLKPELVANGWAVSSTFPNNNYAWYFGTSMASPQVAGALSLLYERYRQLNGGANPPAALIKAAACNTAEDLGNPGPDFTFGFGLLNARRALEAIEQNRYFTGSLANGAGSTHNISVPAGARRLKVLLYWMDKEGLPNAAVHLVNDLDLTVSGPGGTVLPLVLDASPAGVNLPAVPGADHLNNIEQVVIENPANGSYTININGFAVPQGPQQYVVVYEIVNPGVTVEYPYGGETWVPNAVENIRWNAYGNEGNTFTVEYSGNNGASWTVLSNAVPANARSYNWPTGPATPTDSALVRVTRNGTALVGQSSRPFVVLAQPVVTATTVCDGAVQLNWAAVTNATGYDVMRINGDTMQVIGSTNGLSFVVKGLAAGNTHWLAVRAKTANAVGRRSVVASAPVCCGPCTLSDFDNDVKAEVILEPTTGREFTASSQNASRPVKVRFKNLDDAAISGPMTVAYNVNGLAAHTENISPNVAAGATFEHTFQFGHAIPLGGPYVLNIKAWITRPGDTNPANDTVYATAKLLGNGYVFGLPVVDGFETTSAATYNSATMGLAGNDRFDFASSTVRGRLRTFVNTGMARSGNRALTLDQAPLNPAFTADSVTATYNMLFYNLNSVQLRYDFYYKNHSQKNQPGNKVWMRGSENDPWVAAYDLYANQAPTGQWKFANININDVLGSAIPPQALTTSFQVRFGQEGQASAANVVATSEFEDGYTFDDLRLTDAVNDIALQQVTAPLKKDCELGNTTPVTIMVKNYSGSVQSNVPVSYRINGGPTVTETIPTLAANQTLAYTFAALANTAAFGEYSFEFWAGHGPDTYRGNDSILNYSFYKSPLITNFPYYESFEGGNGNWYTNGLNSSWQWGTPAKATIAKAANGNKAWATGLTGNYKDNEYSYLVSPCFDISGMAQPVLSFSHIFELEDGCACDYSWVEYSTDGGETWQRFGTTGNGTNWFDNAAVVAWQVSQKTWHVASYDIPPGNQKIKFRFIMYGDEGVNYEGVAIDDVHVFDKAAIYAGPASVTSGLTQTVSGSNWVHFNDATGKRIASIHPQGQNLGTTNVQVHPYTGQVRFANEQYYANRNIVVQPATQPTAPVKVRFYFTDAEAKALLAAAGCSGCTKPGDPYELGVTQYTGPVAEENGTLSDNTAGTYRFLMPDTVAIIPYDNGYFAEYSVDAFSEFWLGKGSIAPPPANSCVSDTIVYTAASSGTTYQWQVDNGGGFVALINNANYGGATTPALRITGLPTSSTGWRYRCVVNGVPGSAVTLRFTRIWNGSTNTDWTNIANWGCRVVPDEFTDVLIPGGLPHYPLVTANAAIRQLRVSPGATVNVATGVALEVKGR
jgi:hypothetical protein